MPRLAAVNGAPWPEDLLTPPVAAMLASLCRTYRPARDVLLARRAERLAAYRAGAFPAVPQDSADQRAAGWRVAPAPADLADRRCEITGPADAKMMIGALNCGAQVFLCDLEDALSPTWANVVAGHRNIRAAADGTLTFERPDGRVDRLASPRATLTVRPRGLHLPEPRMAVDGAPVPAPIFDVVVAAMVAGPQLAAVGSALYLYLPKLENRHEAEWWDALLADVERRAGLKPRSIRVSVLIETVTAAFEMDEILFALRDRITALNAGRWDYLFSMVKTLGHRPEFRLPDRSQLTMAVPFMQAYAQRLVAVCHRRGAHAMGGMSAFVPNRANPSVTERALAAVRTDKEREVNLGYDGTWVAHPDLVPVATSAFDAVLGDRPNQLDVLPAPGDDAALLDVTVPGATVTMPGLQGNIAVALRYLLGWLGGRGAVTIDGLMEDLATAEIARSQVWQWLHQGVVLADGTVVGEGLVQAVMDEAVRALVAEGADATRVAGAAAVVRAAVLAPELPDFLSLVALDRLG